MDGAWFTRMRWRRRGAWMWPVFVVLTVVDGFILHALPPYSDSLNLVAALLLAGFWNFVAVAVLAHPVGAILRRARPDLPRIIARDYAGTWLVIGIALVIVATGLQHRATISSNRAAMRDAIVRAVAWIGYRAPPQFRGELKLASTLTIQAGVLFRTCVPSADGRRTYCVMVNDREPANRSVQFAGYEPNAYFEAGLGY
jgi:hypothetical protein